MNFHAITVEDKEAAAAARDAYMAAARRSHSAMDRALSLSYKVIADGGSLIDIEATMRETPLHDTGLPKLAIVRADFKEVFLKLGFDGSGVMAGSQEFAERNRVKTRAGTARIELPAQTFAQKNPATGADWPYRNYWDVHRAPVPSPGRRLRQLSHSLGSGEVGTYRAERPAPTATHHRPNLRHCRAMGFDRPRTARHERVAQEKRTVISGEGGLAFD